MSVKSTDLAKAGLPDPGVYRATIDYADVRDAVSREGEGYTYMLAKYTLHEKFGEGPLEFPAAAWDRFYFRGKSLERLKNLIILLTGGLPAGDENDDLKEEELADAIRDGEVYISIFHETDNNNVPRARVGWRFSNNGAKLS